MRRSEELPRRPGSGLSHAANASVTSSRSREADLTTDEDINKLEESLRRLRIEYETYFSGGMPRPPRDGVFRVESVLKRLSADLSQLTFRQRFRFNQLQQRYAVYGGLWRKRTRDLEEGRGRQAEKAESQELFRIVTRSPEVEADKTNQLFDALMEAKRQMGEPAPPIERGVFAEFLRQKAADVKRKLDCENVEFCVKVEDGRVKLKAGRG